jgi:uncharacterized protein YggE
MNEPASTLLSVRGDAHQVVPPDYAVLGCQIQTRAATKVEGLRAAAAVQQQLVTALTELGGQPLTADTGRVPLTWSTRSSTTQPEHQFDEKTGRHGPTGWVLTSVSLSIMVRAFDLLDRLDSAMAQIEQLQVYGVTWGVDADNPAWPQVRAAAIHAAIGKGSDYAAALGGSLSSIEHIADTGLLGGANNSGGGVRASSTFAMAAAAPIPDTPSLDPEPQELVASIEARFVATITGLG